MPRDLVDKIDKIEKLGVIPEIHGSLVVLALGGAIYDTALSQKLLYAADFIMAADSGYDQCVKLGYPPDLLMGDLDSIQQKPTGTPILELNPAKNATDGEHALRQIQASHVSRIVLLGGLGPGRLDHVSYHLEALLGAAREGKSMSITDGRQWVTAFAGPSSQVIHFAKEMPKKMIVSLVPCTPIKDLDLKGLVWDIDHRDLQVPTSLCVSNQKDPQKEAFYLSLKEGELLLFLNPEDYPVPASA